MHLVSVETTPNPNSMKLNLDASAGKPVTYTKATSAGCPEFVAHILAIEGVQSIFVCETFITVNRDPRSDWKPILDAATRAFNADEPDDGIEKQRRSAEHSGQVAVLVQTFRGIPIQVKVADGNGEKRIALAQRFAKAAQHIQDLTGSDFLKERYWADWGIRYGLTDEVAAEIVEEIEGTLNAGEIETLIAKALNQTSEIEKKQARPLASIAIDLQSDDWHKRFLCVQELGTEEAAVPFLAEALKDSQHQIRRLAAAALGASGSIEAVGPLCRALLHDLSVGVRRTAGDALSDLGEVSAEPFVCRALPDQNKLIRWRAARFLADIGTIESLPSLEQAVNDPEFEVQLEVRAAIERITGGKEGSMPAWKKILENTKKTTF